VESGDEEVEKSEESLRGRKVKGVVDSTI